VGLTTPNPSSERRGNARTPLLTEEGLGVVSGEKAQAAHPSAGSAAPNAGALGVDTSM